MSNATANLTTTAADSADTAGLAHGFATLDRAMSRVERRQDAVDRVIADIRATFARIAAGR